MGGRMPDSPNFLTNPGARQLPAPAHEPVTPPPSGRVPFVEPHRAPQQKAPPLSTKRFRWHRWVLGAAVGVVVVLLVPAIYSLSLAGVSAQKAKHALSGVEKNIRTLEFEAAQVNLNEATEELRQGRRHLRGVGVWRDLPWSGTQIRGLENALSAGIETLEGVNDLLETARIVVDVIKVGESALSGVGVAIPPTRRFADLTKEEKREMLRRFQTELPRLRLARDKLDIANELWLRIPQDDLAAPIRSALAPLAETIPLLAETLDNAVPIIEVLLPLAGYPEPRRFVVLLQNANEIRPGGGFIGNVGTVTFDAGDLAEFEFQDVYAIDNPVNDVWDEKPPEPMLRYLGVQKWFLRDSNWSPDFPTSAEQALDFYIRETELNRHAPLDHRPDTLIALEPGFFEDLLGLTGPIVVDGITFDRENFFDTLQFEVEVGFHQQGIPVDQRKDIVARIGDEIVSRLLALPASEWPSVFSIFRESLGKKDVLMYSRDPQFLTILDARGWTGRVRPTNGDYLWVVDANLAALKTDGAMKKNIRYRLDADHPDGPLATVTLTYTNTAPDFRDFRYTRYRSYTRVYVPEGSELLASRGAMKNDIHLTGGIVVPGQTDVFRELGKTVFGAFWSVEPGKTGELEFTYRLPPSSAARIRTGMYHLDIQKQPGVSDTGIRLEHTFANPVRNAVPSEPSSEWGDSRYRVETDTLRDRVFDVELR